MSWPLFIKLCLWFQCTVWVVSPQNRALPILFSYYQPAVINQGYSFFPSRRHLVMSGGTFDCHNWQGEFYQYLVGSPWTEEPGGPQSMGSLSRTWLSDFTFNFHSHALEKEMATHSSVLAWRIPGTGEPGGLPSMGLHRVGHDWSDLAAAAVEVR